MRPRSVTSWFFANRRTWGIPFSVAKPVDLVLDTKPKTGAGVSFSASVLIVGGGGGGGSGYLHPRVLMGESFTAHRQRPPMTEDPDYESNGGKFTNIAMGGDVCNYGGEGLVVIYYA